MDASVGAPDPESAERRGEPARLRALSEEQLLDIIVPIMRAGERSSGRVLLGPGDDAAVVAVLGGSFVATTDAMVRGHDWRDDWSSGQDVGRKAVAQNLGDVAAMGAVPAGLLVSLLADPDTLVEWVVELSRGIAAAAGAADCPVLGGDLGGAPAGVVMISVTAFGDLQGRSPVRRSGAGIGDIVAVAGTLGRSGAGLALLLAGRGGEDDPVVRELVGMHRALVAPVRCGAGGGRRRRHGHDRPVRRARSRRGPRRGGERGRCGARSRAAGVRRRADRPGARRGRGAGGGVDRRGGALAAGHLPRREAPSPRRSGRSAASSPGAGVTVGGVPRTGGGWDHFAG
jgi:thiamine-monophosphate kinase